jgi:hypothetical protein
MKFLSRAVTAAAVALAISAMAASAATPAPAPSVPRSLKATAGDKRVTLSWSPPATGAGIDGYRVDTSPADFPRTTTQNTTLTAAPLTNGRTYTFAVRAHNSFGYSPAAFVTATPRVFPPGPPTNLAATQGPNTGDITISWTPPISNGSSPDGSTPSIDYYTVKVSPGAVSQRIDAPNTLYVAHNTADNLTYTFSVTATNSRGVTGSAAVVYSPYPGGASIGLQPSAGTATTAITVTGQLFLKNESITLYWDATNHVAGTVITDDNGAFTKVVKMFAGAKPGVHRLYANVQPKPFGSYSFQATPTPTPTPGESPSPSSTETPQASGPRTGGGGGGGGISGLDILTRPPFVFLPIIGILGLLGVLIYWAVSSRRRPMAPSSASVVHHATRPDYMEPFGGGAARPVPAAPVPSPAAPPPQPVQPPPTYPPLPAQQVPPAFERPPVQPVPPAFQPPAAAPPPPPQAPPPGPVQWPAPPHPAAAPDEPPDLPEPSD